MGGGEEGGEMGGECGWSAGPGGEGTGWGGGRKGAHLKMLVRDIFALVMGRWEGLWVW